MIQKIYFDMDGVLADFDSGVYELCGIEPLPQDSRDPFDETHMWGEISKVPHFYDKLAIIHGSREMVNIIAMLIGFDRCEILTGIPKPERGIATAASDKKQWMKRNFPKGIKVNTVFKKEKPSFCKGKDYILIDDLQANIEAWEKAGGTGILHRSPQQTIKEVMDLVKYQESPKMIKAKQPDLDTETVT